MPGPRLKRLGRWVLYLVVLAVLARVFLQRVGAVDANDLAFPAAWAVVVAVAAFMAANEILVRAWLALVALGGAELPAPVGRWVWSSTQLTRYTFGMAQVASRAVVARRYGMSPTAGAMTTILEVIWYSSVNGLVAVATIPWWLSGTGLDWAAWLAVVPGLVLALALFRPASFLSLARWSSQLPVLRRVGGLAAAADVPVGRRDTTTLTAAYLGNFAVRLLGFFVLYLGVGGPTDDIGRVVGAFALGHLIGAVAVFAPGGLGPREGVTAVVLAPLLSGGTILALVAMTRLLELVAELLYASLARAARPPAAAPSGISLADPSEGPPASPAGDT